MIEIILIVCIIGVLVVNVYFFAYNKGWNDHDEFIKTFFNLEVDEEKLNILIGELEDDDKEQRN